MMSPARMQLQYTKYCDIVTPLLTCPGHVHKALAAIKLQRWHAVRIFLDMT